MKDLDFRTTIVPAEYLKSNLAFAKKVADAYDDAKEKNASWFAPKIPFYITSPKLINNGKEAHRILKMAKQNKNHICPKCYNTGVNYDAFEMVCKCKNKTTRGGSRMGAGRPKSKEPTKVMRVPQSLVVKVEALIKKHKKV